jgi:hypothetical protein
MSNTDPPLKPEDEPRWKRFSGMFRSEISRYPMDTFFFELKIPLLSPKN